MSLPKPPDGYRLVTAEEKEKPADTEALFWNSMTGSWETREPHKTGTPYRNYTHYAIPIEDAAPGTPDKDGWVEWNPPFNAGDCPVPTDKEVEVRQRNGNIAIVRAGRGKGGPAFWVNEDSGQDIVAYRIVTPAKEEKKEEHYIPTRGEWVNEFNPNEQKWSHSYQASMSPVEYKEMIKDGWRYRKVSKEVSQEDKDNIRALLAKHNLINQPTPTTTNENNDMSFPHNTIPRSAELPRIGSKWAIQSKGGSVHEIAWVLAASEDSVTLKGTKGHINVIPITEWQERTKNELLSRRERKRRLTNSVPVPACLQSPPTSFVTIRALWTLTKAVPYFIGLATTAKWVAPWAVAAYYYLTAKLGW